MHTLAIIVNYKSARLTLAAVQSVLNSAGNGSIQIVVVDNSEDRQEADILTRRLPSGVELVVNPTNMGFGRACNLVYDRYPCDQVLLLNPDAKLLPGCLAQLQQTLHSDSRIAAVSPRVYLDEDRRFLLPPSYSPAWMMMDALSTWIPWLGRRLNNLLSHLWRRRAIKHWHSDEPVNVDNLSGGLVLLKKELVEKTGELFDPDFFLYFEDTDLFLRLRQSGFTLMLDPRAEAIHFYNQCDPDGGDRKQAHMVSSKKKFIQKHYPWLAWFSEKRNTDTPQLPVPINKGTKTNEIVDCFVLDIPEPFQKDGWLFEFSPNPNLIPAVGHFGEACVIDLPETCWELLAPGSYFCRIGPAKGLGLNSRNLVWKVKTT